MGRIKGGALMQHKRLSPGDLFTRLDQYLKLQRLRCARMHGGRGSMGSDRAA